MGYSHYWGRPKELDPGRFAAFADECRYLRRQAGLPILGLFGGLKIGAELGWGQAIFTGEMVCFNGRPQCEPLTIPRCVQSSGYAGEYGLFWDGAKTNQLPYDRLVIAVLLAFKHHFPEGALYSDGSRDDWAAGIYLYEHATGRPAPAFADLGKPSPVLLRSPR